VPPSQVDELRPINAEKPRSGPRANSTKSVKLEYSRLACARGSLLERSIVDVGLDRNANVSWSHGIDSLATAARRVEYRVSNLIPGRSLRAAYVLRDRVRK
jgi:hypothetical protein